MMKNPGLLQEKLQFECSKIHAKFKTVSIDHLQDLKTEINSWQHDGLITKAFLKQNYGHFIFTPPKSLPHARSIIIVCIPQKLTYVDFFQNGKHYQTIIPPTYIYSEKRARCKDLFSKILGQNGYFVENAILPFKLLAVRSGLAKYGKNNIIYVDGLGSFIRLEAFYTDYEFTTNTWQKKQMMKPCATCLVCHNACPTRCIPKDRFLIHADQCLTYLNENKGKFPAWVPPQAHNAVVGCLHCQRVCPQNKNIIEYNKQKITFSEKDTSILIKHVPWKDVPTSLQKKLAYLNLDEYYHILGRNLSALIDKENKNKNVNESSIA
jgi:epoxyqueuosine reductase